MPVKKNLHNDAIAAILKFVNSWMLPKPRLHWLGVLLFIGGFSLRCYCNKKGPFNTCNVSTGLSVGVKTTNVSYEYYGLTFNNLTLGYGLFYNGSINLSVTGGLGPYSYQLTNPPRYQQNGYFTGLGPGTYHFVITDANGQSVDTTVVLTSIYPQPSVSLSNINLPNSCNSLDGSFTLTGSGGTPPYLYSIDGGTTFSTNNVFSGLTQGYYPMLLVKDAHGQLGMTGFNVNYFSGNFFNSKNCPFAILSDLYGTASCGSSKGGVSVVSVGGAPPVQFSDDGINYVAGSLISQPNGSTQYGYNFLNLASGNHQIFGKDANGVVTITTIPILFACNLSISATSVDAACHQNDGSITITAVNGLLPYTYTMDGANFQYSNLFSALNPGQYTVWVKDANGVVTSTQATVGDKCPIVSAVASYETCGQKNGSITANGSKGTQPYVYSIDGINFQSGNVFSNLVAGMYIATLKDALGYTSQASVVIENNCLQANLTIVNSTCSENNGSISVKAANGSPPYEFSIDGVNFQTKNNFDNLPAGTYTILVKDGYGSTATSAGLIIDAAGPKFDVELSSASCSNINGSINLIATGGTMPLVYSIDGGAHFQNSSFFGGLDSGQYITVVKDANNCIIKDTIILTALSTPFVFIGNDTSLCQDSAITLVASPAPGYKFKWQDNSSQDTYTVTMSGKYYVTVTSQDDCSASDTVNIKYIPKPLFSLGPDTSLCNFQQLKLHPTLPTGDYLWNTGSKTNSIMVSNAGTYWLKVVNQGCVFTDSLTVQYKANPSVSLGNDTSICSGTTFLLDATYQNATYLWQDQSTAPYFIVTSPGSYSVKVSKDGCDTTAQIKVNYLTPPFLNLGKDTILCVGQRLELIAQYPDSKYLWQDGSVVPQFSVSAPGIYVVKVSNNCGVASDSIKIEYEDCGCKFYLPSAFTPNNDGNNDIFKPRIQCNFSGYELKIFNRWGQLIFRSVDPGKGWDGFVHNTPQPAGGYVWQLKYVDNLIGRGVSKSGAILLIR